MSSRVSHCRPACTLPLRSVRIPLGSMYSIRLRASFGLMHWRSSCVSRPRFAASASASASSPGSSSPSENEQALASSERSALESELQRQRDAYYNLDKSRVSDATYDALEKLAGGHGASGTVGAVPTAGTHAKVRHAVPMLSLHSENAVDGLHDWHRRLVKRCADVERARWCVEPKVDGVAISLRYEPVADGTSFTLACASSRGDGLLGEDVSEAVRSLAHREEVPRDVHIPPDVWRTWRERLDVPDEFASSVGALEVRGEAFFARDEFAALVSARKAAGATVPANARNAVSGALRRLDTADENADAALDDLPPIRFLAYDLLLHSKGKGKGKEGKGGSKAHQPACHSYAMNFTTDVLHMSAHCEPCASFVDAATRASEYIEDSGRDSLAYETDGAVLKLDDVEQSGLRDLVGTSRTEPRYAVALKRPALAAVTTLEAVECRVGRNGQVTPLARLSPVTLGGVTVTNATLHNLEVAAGLGLVVGGRVVVERAGDVIPRVTMAVPGEGDETNKWQPPNECPACGSPLVRLPTGPKGIPEKIARCMSSQCPEQVKHRTVHFAKQLFDGVGPGKVEKLLNSGVVTHDVADFFEVTVDSVAALDGFQTKSATKLVSAIESARASASVGDVLYALSVPNLGAISARALGDELGTLRAVSSLGDSVDRHADVEGIIGPSSLKSLLTWLDDASNRRLLERLHDVFSRGS
ncbi:DNA ligase [Pseudoscourfieldia marina]